jgi:hypothetical protein
MGVTNRDKDVSEQKENLFVNFGAVATGATLQLGIVPWPCELKAVRVAANGLSGSPTVDLRILRFVVGAGMTSIAGGATQLTVQAVGTSGPQSMVLASAGSSLLQLQAGDVILAAHGAANTNVLGVSYSLVLQALQDIKSHFGS